MTKEQIRGKIQNAYDVEALEYLWEWYDCKVKGEAVSFREGYCRDATMRDIKAGRGLKPLSNV